MYWQQLQSEADLERIHEMSYSRPVLIYKHSARCHICTMALGRIERGWGDEDSQKMTPYFLDVLKFRRLSDAVENKYRVTHQSPQVLVIRDGNCVYQESHSAITYHDTLAAAGGENL